MIWGSHPGNRRSSNPKTAADEFGSERIPCSPRSAKADGVSERIMFKIPSLGIEDSSEPAPKSFNLNGLFTRSRLAPTSGESRSKHRMRIDRDLDQERKFVDEWLSRGRPPLNNTGMPDTAWGLRDVLIVTICVLVVDGLLFIASFNLLGAEKKADLVSEYGRSLLMLFLPVFWIRKKFGVSKEALGLRGRKINMPYVILGLAIAAVYIGSIILD